LEIFITKSVEGTTRGVATDLAALRQDAARLAETISGLAQHQTQAAKHRFSEALGDVKDRSARTATDAQFVRRAARSRPVLSVIR
jgi:ElaB/YqjD/DUF883 family membrane-anchored ribosome-binding protein